MPKLPYDITTNVVWLDIQTALIIIRDVATGRRIMAMIISLPGFGKSFLANREMRKANCAFHLSNPQDANAVVNILWQIESGTLRNSKGELIAVLLLDDADACARRETPANVVKGAFGEARKVIWESQAAFRNAAWLDKANPRYNPDRHSPLIPPLEFNVSVRLLWLSNADFTDEAVLGGTPEHFRALVSRGLDPFRIRDDAENDGYAVFLYTHHAATEGGFLKAARADGGYPYEIARQAVDFYVNHVHRLIDIVPRRLKQIATVFDYYRDPREREPRLQAMLRPTDQRPRLKLPESWVPVLLWSDRPPTRQAPAEHPERPPASSAEPIIPSEPEPPLPTAVPPDTPNVIDPNAGFEELDERKCLEHFGISWSTQHRLAPRVLAVRSIVEERIGNSDIGAWIKAGYAQNLNGQTLLNVAKIREMVDDARAQLAQAQADGFVIAKPSEYGAENHSEAHALMLRALGLQGVVDGLKPLVDGGYLRLIGGMRLYEVEKMRALMEKGRAAQEPPPCRAPVTIDPPRPDPRKLLISTVSLTQTIREIVKDHWELKSLRGHVDPQRRALALDNRFRAYYLIEMTDDDTFMDEAHRVLRDQGLRFWEKVGDYTIDAALEIVGRSEQ